MTTIERQELQNKNEIYLELLDFYAKNRAVFQSMTDKEYWQHIDDILDEINEIKRLLEADNGTHSND